MDVRGKFTAQALNQEEMGPSTRRWMGSTAFLTLWRRGIACAKHQRFPVLLVAAYLLHGLKTFQIIDLPLCMSQTVVRA